MTANALVPIEPMILECCIQIDWLLFLREWHGGVNYLREFLETGVCIQGFLVKFGLSNHR